jgi:nitrogen fixation/metabolism regulation signal transduction histidine kinase
VLAGVRPAPTNVAEPRYALRHEVDAYNADEVSQNIGAQADADRAYREATMLAAGGLAVSLLTAIVIAGYLARRVVAPVRRTARMAQRLADGCAGSQ